MVSKVVNIKVCALIIGNAAFEHENKFFYLTTNTKMTNSVDIIFK